MTAMSEPASTPDGRLRDPRLRSLAEDSGYEILNRVGAGGMGIVYRALDADGRDVAIKLLRPEIADDPRARERLHREVAAQQKVRNDAIARILDAELDSSDAFVVTEFIPGPTLEDAIRTHGPLHPEAVRELGIVLGEALTDIHAAGVVHRDLKPSNILLRGATEADLTGFDPDGPSLEPVIIDFGIAQAAEQSRLTSTGLVMGTAAYLDPEVVASNETGPASDWWSWAAMLAFAATGREPFGSGRADLVFLRADRGELDVDGLPTELAGWLREALRARPADRPDPEQMLARLDQLDLQRYDDPEPMEQRAAPLEGGQRADADHTEVLSLPGVTGSAAVGGAALGGAAFGSAGLGASGAGSAARGSSALGTAVPGDAASASGVTGEGTEELPAQADADRTEVIPVHRDDAPTEAIAPVREDSATQALPVVEDPMRARLREDRTEAIPTIGPPTAVLPVVREDTPPPHRGTTWPPQQAAQPENTQATYASPQYAPPQYASPQDMQARDMPAPYAHAQQTQPQQAQPQYAPPQDGQAPYGAAASPYGASPYGAPGYGAPAAPTLPSRAPRRPLLVWLGHAVLIALAAVAPVLALAFLLALGTIARTWERSHRALERARARGRTGGAAWSIGAAGPFRVALGLVEMMLTVLLPSVLGVLVMLAVDAVCFYALGSALPASVLYAGAMVVTLLLAWVGIGGRTTRDGAHRMVDAAAPDTVWTLVVGGLLVLLLGAIVSVAYARAGLVDFFPLPVTEHPESLLPWRR